MNLREVNSIIFNTECGALLLDGLSCSQPILSIGDQGLVDNFFIYSLDMASGSISAPKTTFGIYSDLGEVAYVNYSPEYDVKIYENVIKGNGADLFALYEKYESLYPLIRNAVFKTCDQAQAEAVKEYCEILENISGADIWRFYNELFPDFFGWAKKVINRVQ